MMDMLLSLQALFAQYNDPATVNDRVLIHRPMRGDTAALEVLHKWYYRKLYKLARVKFGNEDDTYDVASEAFVYAVQNVFALDPLTGRGRGLTALTKVFSEREDPTVRGLLGGIGAVAEAHSLAYARR
ncbi:MAG: hypothetical protein ACUVX8_17325 [Candidatus Zipacnadales bacterium]